MSSGISINITGSSTPVNIDPKFFQKEPEKPKKLSWWARIKKFFKRGG